MPELAQRLYEPPKSRYATFMSFVWRRTNVFILRQIMDYLRHILVSESPSAWISAVGYPTLLEEPLFCLFVNTLYVFSNRAYIQLILPKYCIGSPFGPLVAGL